MEWSQHVAARFAAVTAFLESCLTEERERWLLWLPVFLSLGIAAYFALPAEPHSLTGTLAVATVAVIALIVVRRPVIFAATLLTLFVALGFASAQWRTMRVTAPVIQEKMRPVTVIGTAEKVTLVDKGGFRLILGEPEVQELPTTSTPARVRITVRTKSDVLLPGDSVRLRAILLPPPEPVAPGAYDFAHQAWFDRIGAVGYVVSSARRVPAIGQRTLLEEASFVIWRGQAQVAERIRSALPGTKGAVAAALLTGDRGGIPEAVTGNLRDAGLAHLLAISGLHVGLVAGILFFAVRGILALWESAALRYPIKKWAAMAALAGAFGYLLLTGATVSTQRAFIMTAIFLLAVMVDRAVITMRPVAWAATVILLFTPESLWQAGFQMSFAAVIALIATYEFSCGRFVNI